MLERARGEGAFRPQYSFTLDSIWPADLIVSNHYASTMPGFRFVTMKFVNLATPSGLTSLIDRQFSQNGEKREIVSAADYRDTLADVFGIDLTEEEIERLGPLG
jgi:N-hydroxyarylamine O-acetyltransferase